MSYRIFKAGDRVLLPASRELNLPEQRGTVIDAAPGNNVYVVSVDIGDRMTTDRDGLVEVAGEDMLRLPAAL